MALEKVFFAEDPEIRDRSSISSIIQYDSHSLVTTNIRKYYGSVLGKFGKFGDNSR